MTKLPFLVTRATFLLLSTAGAHAFGSSFHQPPPPTRATFAHRPLSAASSISTFDETDFEGTVGDWPYAATDMKRLDESDDSRFYDMPRYVTHIDDRAIAALTAFYEAEFTAMTQRRNGNEIAVLDLCSSWISHFPEDAPYLGRVVGIGMNVEELNANKQLNEYYVQDLNKEPRLSTFDDDSFDVICNVVSVDYLTSPREIFQEMHRILRPGGVCLMTFSNRCFPTKAVGMWLQADDIGRMTIVASYFHYTAKWASIEALDLIGQRLLTPERPTLQEMFSNPAAGFAWMNTASSVAKSNSGDPMFAVKGTK
jgi:SAM-dependent methyltransferase